MWTLKSNFIGFILGLVRLGLFLSLTVFIWLSSSDLALQATLILIILPWIMISLGSGGYQKHYGIITEIIMIAYGLAAMISIIPQYRLQSLPLLSNLLSALPSTSSSTSPPPVIPPTTNTTLNFNPLNLNAIPNSTLVEGFNYTATLPTQSTETITSMFANQSVNSLYNQAMGTYLNLPVGFIFPNYVSGSIDIFTTIQPTKTLMEIWSIDNLWQLSFLLIVGFFILEIVLHYLIKENVKVSKKRIRWGLFSVLILGGVFFFYKAGMYVLFPSASDLTFYMNIGQLILFGVLCIGFFTGFYGVTSSEFNNHWIHVGGAPVLGCLYIEMSLIFQYNSFSDIILIFGGALCVFIIANIHQLDELKDWIKRKYSKNRYVAIPQPTRIETKFDRMYNWFHRTIGQSTIYLSFYLMGIMLLCKGWNIKWYHTTLKWSDSDRNVPCAIKSFTDDYVSQFFEFTQSDFFLEWLWPALGVVGNLRNQARLFLSVAYPAMKLICDGFYHEFIPNRSFLMVICFMLIVILGVVVLTGIFADGLQFLTHSKILWLGSFSIYTITLIVAYAGDDVSLFIMNFVLKDSTFNRTMTKDGQDMFFILFALMGLSLILLILPDVSHPFTDNQFDDGSLEDFSVLPIDTMDDIYQIGKRAKRRQNPNNIEINPILQNEDHHTEDHRTDDERKAEEFIKQTRLRYEATKRKKEEEEKKKQEQLKQELQDEKNEEWYEQRKRQKEINPKQTSTPVFAWIQQHFHSTSKYDTIEAKPGFIRIFIQFILSPGVLMTALTCFVCFVVLTQTNEAPIKEIAISKIPSNLPVYLRPTFNDKVAFAYKGIIDMMGTKTFYLWLINPVLRKGIEYLKNNLDIINNAFDTAIHSLDDLADTIKTNIQTYVLDFVYGIIDSIIDRVKDYIQPLLDLIDICLNFRSTIKEYLGLDLPTLPNLPSWLVGDTASARIAQTNSNLAPEITPELINTTHPIVAMNETITRRRLLQTSLTSNADVGPWNDLLRAITSFCEAGGYSGSFTTAYDNANSVVNTALGRGFPATYEIDCTTHKRWRRRFLNGGTMFRSAYYHQLMRDYAMTGNEDLISSDPQYNTWIKYDDYNAAIWNDYFRYINIYRITGETLLISNLFGGLNDNTNIFRQILPHWSRIPRTIPPLKLTGDGPSDWRAQTYAYDYARTGDYTHMQQMGLVIGWDSNKAGYDGSLYSNPPNVLFYPYVQYGLLNTTNMYIRFGFGARELIQVWGLTTLPDRNSTLRKVIPCCNYNDISALEIDVIKEYAMTGNLTHAQNRINAVWPGDTTKFPVITEPQPKPNDFINAVNYFIDTKLSGSSRYSVGDKSRMCALGWCSLNASTTSANTQSIGVFEEFTIRDNIQTADLTSSGWTFNEFMEQVFYYAQFNDKQYLLAKGVTFVARPSSSSCGCGSSCYEVGIGPAATSICIPSCNFGGCINAAVSGVTDVTNSANSIIESNLNSALSAAGIDPQILRHFFGKYQLAINIFNSGQFCTIDYFKIVVANNLGPFGALGITVPNLTNMSNFIPDLVAGFKGFVTDSLSLMADAIQAIAQGILIAVKEVLNVLIEALAEILPWIIEKVLYVINLAIGIIEDIIMSLLPSEVRDFIEKTIKFIPALKSFADFSIFDGLFPSNFLNDVGDVPWYVKWSPIFLLVFLLILIYFMNTIPGLDKLKGAISSALLTIVIEILKALHDIYAILYEHNYQIGIVFNNLIWIYALLAVCIVFSISLLLSFRPKTYSSRIKK